MMEIRQGMAADLDSAAEIYAQSFNAISNEGWTISSAKKLLEYWLNRQPDMFFVAVEGENILGGIVGNIKPWYDGIRIQDEELFVDPEQQGRGIGKQLLAHLLSKAIEKYNTTTLEGITFSQDKFPLSWYERIGFRKTDALIVVEGNCRKILENLNKNP